MTLRLLLVEDDRQLRNTLRQSLLVEGYEILTAASLSEALAIYHQAQTVAKPFDIILLDLGLPDGDGSDLLAKVRRKQSTPVIVISARDTEAAIVQLLDAGADDYLVKPFTLGELLARIRVVMRHRGNHLQAAVTFYQCDSLTVDLLSHKVMVAGSQVHLTPTEYNLLARLVRSSGQVVTHRQLLKDVWGDEFIEHTHYLRLYMGQLRSKLEMDPAEPVLLLTEPGVGYRLHVRDE
ncbi:MAG TPA: response regulator [Cellvibrio sp.]|nr:response regulator [Cellvibrio sp.]